MTDKLCQSLTKFSVIVVEKSKFFEEINCN
jgi:hypothetical protein